MKCEVEKLSRIISVEDLLSCRFVDSSATLRQKGQKVADKVSKGLNASLKLEVGESRQVIDNQRSEINHLKRQKEDWLKIQQIVEDNIEKENNDILEYFNAIFTQKDFNNNSDTPTNFFKRNIQNIKKLIGTFNHNFTRLHKKATNNANEISDLNETITYLNEQLKTVTFRTECLEDENHVLRRKTEQTEINNQCSVDELNTMQKRLRRIEEERNIYLEENMELKGGKIGMHGHYDNLDDENEKLLEKLKQVEEENDIMHKSLHEQMKKTNQYSSEIKEFEYKCEEFEHTITKMRREYIDMTREMSRLTQENEEMKTSVQDNERERMLFKRNIKSFETNNKDLEDQLFHITGQNQKTNHDYEKMRLNIQEYNTMIKELENKIAICEQDKQNFQTDLKNIRMEKLDLENSNKHLNSQLSVKEDSSEKVTIIISGYEELLLKLLHQRKEIISILCLEKTELFSNTSFKINSSQSMEYKLPSEIEDNLLNITSEIDSSFNSLARFLRSSEDDWKFIGHHYRDLLHFMETIDEQDKDSCYSTDGEIIEPSQTFLQKDIHAIKASLNSSNINNTNRFENVQKLVGKIKVLVKHATLSDEKLTRMKHKSKKSIKITRQLQLKLKHHKSLENNKRNRILYLSKRLKFSKTHHNTFHEKHYNDTLNYHVDDNVMRSPLHRCISFERSHVILNELSESFAKTEETLEKVLKSANKCSNEETKVEIIDNFKKVKTCLTATRDILFNKLSNDRCRKVDTTPEESKKSALQEQRQYMIEHVKFTNQRLEVLLNCLKGREENKDDIKSGETDHNNNFAGALLKRVRDSFKSDENIMKRAVDVLQLTKAISMTELDEIQENKAIDEEHLEVIILIKKMNENIEIVLREARAQASEKNNKSESTFTLVGNDENLAENSFDASISNTFLKFDTLKRESKLKTALESTQKRVGDLSEYLKQREDDLKERDEIIATVYKEYEELKQKANEGNDINGSTSERIIMEYAKAKTRLEKENEFLQLVVREVREELLNLQKGYKREEDSHINLQESVNELQMSKLSLEQSLDKMASELNIVKRDKEYLMQSLHLAGMTNLYQDLCYGTPYSPRSTLHNNIQRMYDNQFYTDCICCAQNSESSVLPFSDEEWISAVSCDDCDSVISDQENLEVISSSDSQITTCSKLAKNIKTSEATEKIKSKNRPLRYLQKETRTRKPLLSPRKSSTNTYETSNASDVSSVTNLSIVSKDSRVLGRRESNTRCRNQDSNLRSNVQRYYNNSASVTSQESNASSPSSFRTTNSHKEINDLNDYTPVVENNTWNEVDVSPFLNPKFDGKKRKKKFLQFGKK